MLKLTFSFLLLMPLMVFSQTCQRGTWIGNQNSAWNNSSNWCDGIVPSDTSSVILPAGRLFYPKVTGDVTVNNIQIQPGASLEIVTGTLTVTGILDVSGQLIIDPGANINVQGSRTNNDVTVWPKLIKETNYNPSGIDVYYYTITEDTIQHTITFVDDTVTNTFKKYYYDATGRLVKIERNDYDTLQTQIITRNGNQISWSRPNIDAPGAPDDTTIVTITGLPGNKKQIQAERKYNGYPSDYFNFTVNANNLREYEGTQYYYDNTGKLDSTFANSYHSGDITYFTVSKHFTKDNNNNQYWLKLLDKIYGPDLLWAYQDHYSLDLWLPNFLAGYHSTSINDREYLYRGSLTSQTELRQSFLVWGGVTYPDPIKKYSYEDTLTYDAQGRITKLVQNYNGKLVCLIEVTY
jgi:hypothetical protein